MMELHNMISLLVFSLLPIHSWQMSYHAFKEESRNVSMVSTRLADQKCPEVNKDYYGNDLSGHTKTTVDTWQKCGELCQNTPGCKFWTWTPPGSAYPKWCHLKTAKSKVSFYDKAVSGAKSCTELSPDYDPWAPTKFPPLWREDGRCGSQFPLEDGNPAQCNPAGDYCCGQYTRCGKTDGHCNCNGCKDYSPKSQASRSCLNQDDCRVTFLKLPNPNGGDWQSGYDRNGVVYEYAGKDDAYESGCYGYTSGKYAGHYFFGNKGTDAEKKTPLSGEKIRTECNREPGWGAWTEYSSYANKNDEEIVCPNPDRSYIVQSISRWTDINDDDKQIRWLCSPPNNTIITGTCEYHSSWSNAEKKDANQQCNSDQAMVGIKKDYFNGWNDEDDWQYKIRCCKLGNAMSVRPNSCKWEDKTWTHEPNIWSNKEASDWSKDEYSPLNWDEKVFFTGMRTTFYSKGAKQNRILQFRTCEFGCKVTDIKILDKPNFIDKGWEVVGKHALWDCETNSIDFGLSNEVSIEESLDLEVSKEYTNEVNGQVTVGVSAQVDAKFLGAGGSISVSTEVSAGYSHTWTNGRSRTRGKATAASTGTSLDKSMQSDNGVAAWVLMYTKKIEYESQTVRAIYTKQCGDHQFKEVGSMTIAAQKFTSFKMDIERHDFTTRRECKVKRRQVGPEAFGKKLTNTWLLEAPRQESKFRGDFWRALNYDTLPCGVPNKSYKQVSYNDIDHTTRCMFDGIKYKDIDTYEECQNSCAFHGLNMVAYLPNSPHSKNSALSSTPSFASILAALKDGSGRYTKYPGCFVREDGRANLHSGYVREQCIWNGNLNALNQNDPNYKTAHWQGTYWPVDLNNNYYPLCNSVCPEGWQNGK